MTDFEQEARELVAYSPTAIGVATAAWIAGDDRPAIAAVAAALRKAEARVWREAAGMLVPGDHRAQQFIERAEKLERAE